MEDIRSASLASYQDCSDEIKQLASDLFKKFDHDEDGKVKARDLLEFLEQGGYGGIKPSFFEKLGKDQDGLLDFEEAIMLYYVVMTTNIKQDDYKTTDSTSSETPKRAEHAQLKVIEEKLINHHKNSGSLKMCTILPGPGLPYPGLPCPALPYPGLPCPGLPYPGLPDPRLPCPGLPGPGLPCTGLPGPGHPSPGLPGPGLPDSGSSVGIGSISCSIM